ncbi:unnamed protein product [Amoebophrya sp. A120]|nr:unnamed protein product [Amoebophrya sp. A120]|eukprot:GSA120T00018062001.1
MRRENRTGTLFVFNFQLHHVNFIGALRLCFRAATGPAPAPIRPIKCRNGVSGCVSSVGSLRSTCLVVAKIMSSTLRLIFMTLRSTLSLPVCSEDVETMSFCGRQCRKMKQSPFLACPKHQIGPASWRNRYNVLVWVWLVIFIEQTRQHLFGCADATLAAMAAASPDMNKKDHVQQEEQQAQIWGQLARGQSQASSLQTTTAVETGRRRLGQARNDESNDSTEPKPSKNAGAGGAKTFEDGIGRLQSDVELEERKLTSGNATTNTETATMVGYLQPPPNYEVSRHLCCNYNPDSPRQRKGPFNGFRVTLPKATNATAAVDAGCNAGSNFPREFTKEYAACDFCACLWYYGAPARQRCCSIKEFGMAGVDPETQWEYCTGQYHVLETRSGNNDIHICELFYDIYPFQELSAAQSRHTLTPHVGLTALATSLLLPFILPTTTSRPRRFGENRHA